MALEYNPYSKTSILPQDFFMQIIQALLYKQMNKQGQQQGNQQSEIMKMLLQLVGSMGGQRTPNQNMMPPQGMMGGQGGMPSFNAQQIPQQFGQFFNPQRR